MANTEVAASLKAAEAAIAAGEYKNALALLKPALKTDRKIDALLLIGKAAFHLKEYEQAELAYRRALEASPGLFDAWEGLAELFQASNNTAGEIEANEYLLQQTSEEDPRDRAARLRLAAAYSRAGALDAAVQQYNQLLSAELPGSPARLATLCALADVMLRQDEAAVNDELAKKMESRMESPTAAGSLSPMPMSPTAPGSAGSGPRRTVSCLEMDVLAARAVHDSESEERSVFMVLAEICETAPPALQYLPYREEYVRRCLLRIFAAPPRSTERQQFRLAALRECVSVLTHGGSCSPLPYEAAVWLLEEEEEIKGGQVPVGGQEVGGAQALAGGVQAGAEGHIGAGRCDVVALATENFSRRLIHQFPWHPTARVLLGLMLRRHAVHSGRPVSQRQRRQLERLLRDAMGEEANVDAASGFKALAELQYENRNYQDSVDTAMRGLRWLAQRRERGHEALTQAALGLRLVLAKALYRLNRLDEAERHFKSLAGWVTEGEAAFCEMCGSAPTSIHQHALRGIALVALARGDVDAARAQYERILGKAALGRGPAEHWAHADYGWLLFQAGDLQGARFHLEAALKVATEEGCAATDSQVGEHRYRLGEVYWKMRGRYRSEKQFAYNQFLEAAKVEGHAQAPALAALGRYFQQVEVRPDSAERCFKRALAIDPNVDIAGDGLSALLIASGRPDAAVALCKGVASRAPHATWAFKRLGYLLLEQKQHAEAIAALQAALRSTPSDAPAWEALGAAYQPLGRLTAALKAYTRALELDPSRVYSWVQAGTLHLTLGAPLKALASHESALKLDPDHPAALLGAAEALAASAGAYIAEGALAAAAANLSRAAELAGQCAAKNGALVSAWKQLGDVLLLVRHAPPEPEEHGSGGGARALSAWRGRVTAVQRARRAYVKALHLRPSSAPGWHDVACAFYHESQLQRAHSAAGSGAGAPPAALRSAAEACLRGALRLDPTSAELWAAMGVTSMDRTVSEYSLSRSLQLEPRESSVWVALARLYIDAGERGLAERCLQQGRSHDPAVAAIWEAMAALAALGDGPAAAQERADFNEHAVGLGAGAEGLLGYAQAALAGGKTAAGAGDAYAVACRAATLDPLNPAALNVWGLACETKGDAVGAVKAYKTALELLPGALGADLAQRHPATTPAGLSLETALKINLARALVGAGQHGEAVGIYGELEFEGVLDGQASALLAYAVARAATGDASGAAYSASAALEAAGSDGTTVAAAVRMLVTLAVAEGRPGDVLGVLRSHLSRLSEAKAPADAVKELWRAAMAAAAVAGSGADAVAAEARRGAATADQEDADFFADLQTLAGTAAAVAGGASAPRCALSSHSKALHLSPWSSEARGALAAAASDASQGYAPAVLRLLRCGGTAGPAALATAAAALLDRGIAAGARAAREQARALSRAIHERPTDGKRWYLAALVAAQVAAAEPTAAAHKTALSLATCALALTDDVSMQAKLLMCVSEGRLRSREPETRAQALAAAQEAVQRAPDNAEALRQVARCHWAVGDVQKAQVFFTRAMEAAAVCGDGAAGAISAMELAACLESSGRSRDAAEVLAEEAARLQAANAATPPPPLRAAAAQRDGMVQQVLLQRALTLARLGDLDAAKSAADAATHSEEGAVRGVGLVAAGAVRLQQALAAGADSEAGASLLGESRRLLSEALQKGQDNVVSRALLARLEASGTMRKKEERVAAHAAEALRLAGKPAPAPLVELLGRLQGSRTMCAKAVHAEPWRVGWWAELQQV